MIGGERDSTFVRRGWPIVRKYCRASFHADSTAASTAGEEDLVQVARCERRQLRRQVDDRLAATTTPGNQASCSA